MSANWYADVLDFTRSMGQHVGDGVSVPPEPVRRLRIDLLREEWREIEDAVFARDLPALADGIVDYCYVALGTGVAYHGPGLFDAMRDRMFCDRPAPAFGIKLETLFETMRNHACLLGRLCLSRSAGDVGKRRIYLTVYFARVMAVECRIDLRPVWDAVHEANMQKASGPVREDGKVLKPANWSPPDVAGLLRAQGWEG